MGLWELRKRMSWRTFKGRERNTSKDSTITTLLGERKLLYVNKSPLEYRRKGENQRNDGYLRDSECYFNLGKVNSTNTKGKKSREAVQEKVRESARKLMFSSFARECN